MGTLKGLLDVLLQTCDPLASSNHVLAMLQRPLQADTGVRQLTVHFADDLKAEQCLSLKPFSLCYNRCLKYTYSQWFSNHLACLATGLTSRRLTTKIHNLPRRTARSGVNTTDLWSEHH